MKRGFTLIELMVSVSIFAVVLLITISAVLSILDANRKAQSLSSVMDNLNASLESMTRNIKTNNIGSVTGDSISVIADFDAITQEGTGDIGTFYTYRFHEVNGKGSIQASTDFIEQRFIDITAPEVDIDLFNVAQLEPNDDCSQPKVLINIKGVAGVDLKTRTKFSIQTVVSQRDFYLPTHCFINP